MRFDMNLVEKIQKAYEKLSTKRAGKGKLISDPSAMQHLNTIRHVLKPNDPSTVIADIIDGWAVHFSFYTCEVSEKLDLGDFEHCEGGFGFYYTTPIFYYKKKRACQGLILCEESTREITRLHLEDGCVAEDPMFIPAKLSDVLMDAFYVTATLTMMPFAPDMVLPNLEES